MSTDKIREFQAENKIWFNFFNNLRSIADVEGLSIDKFAKKYSEKSDLSESTIKSWIDRVKPKEPSLSNAVKLAKALGTTVDRLCEPCCTKNNKTTENDDGIAILLNNIFAGNPNYKINFNDGICTLFAPEERYCRCEVMYLPLSRANDDRPLYKGDLIIKIDNEGFCRMSLTVDTVVGKRATYKGVVVLLNPMSSKPTYWCLLKLVEQSERGKMEMNVPAEFISYSFIAPERLSWKTIIVQVGNIISNSKNPAMFRALFIKKNDCTDNRGTISDDDLKKYYRGLLEIYDLQQIPIHKEFYDILEKYFNESGSCDRNEYLKKYFDGVDVIKLGQTFRKYFTQPNANDVMEIYYLNPITPPYSDVMTGDLIRHALLTAWLRGQGKNAYLNELDEKETGFAEKIYQWLVEQSDKTYLSQ